MNQTIELLRGDASLLPNHPHDASNALHWRIRVNGLNLTVPEDAKELIKPWDKRETTDKFVDSGVDDQACHRLCLHRI